MSDFHDRQGRPISRDEYHRLRGDPLHKRVAFTEVGDFTVSTVWLGLDHGWGEGPPIIFETMVFNNGQEELTERYPTEVMALAGHDQIVAEVRGRTPEERDTTMD